MPSCIYLLTNTINQKQYVGFTSKTLNERCEKHQSKARGGTKGHLYNAIRKYGWAVFTSEIIYMSKDVHHCKNEAEVALIADYNTHIGRGYNLTAGGDGTVGYIRSAEAIAKQILTHTGYKHTIETKQKLREANLGKKHSDDTKAKMSKSRLGNKYALGSKHSDEIKAKQSIRQTIHKMPEKYHLIDMYKFFTLIETAKFYGVSKSTIAKWNLKLKNK